MLLLSVPNSLGAAPACSIELYRALLLPAAPLLLAFGAPDVLSPGAVPAGLVPHLLLHLVPHCSDCGVAGAGRASVGLVARGPQRGGSGGEGRREQQMTLQREGQHIRQQTAPGSGIDVTGKRGSTRCP